MGPEVSQLGDSCALIDSLGEVEGQEREEREEQQEQ